MVLTGRREWTRSIMVQVGIKSRIYRDGVSTPVFLLIFRQEQEYLEC